MHKLTHQLTTPTRAGTSPRLASPQQETELIDATALRLPPVSEDAAPSPSQPEQQAGAGKSWTISTPSGREARRSFHSSRQGSRVSARGSSRRSTQTSGSSTSFAHDERSRGMSILASLDHRTSILDDDEDELAEKRAEDTNKMLACTKSVRFLVKTVVQLAHFALSITALVIFATGRRDAENQPNISVLFWAQLFLVLIDMLLSIVITFSDLDVQRWIVSYRIGGPFACLRTLGIGFIFGVLQLIHVKRAYARQIHVAEVLSQLQGKELGEDQFLWTGPALGAEAAYPVNFITGIFSAMISTYASLMLHGLEDERDLGSQLMLAYGVSSVMIAGLAVVDLDLAVSNYVVTRYHFNPNKKGTRVGSLQVFFPAVHIAYRISEVMMRAVLLTMILVFIMSKLASTGIAIGLVTGFFFLEYVMGLWYLRFFSPQDEIMLVHAQVGIALMLSNVTRLIDVPGFCRPAQRVSHLLELWHVLPLLTWVTIFLLTDAPEDQCGDGNICVQDRWDWNKAQLIAAAVVHFVTRFAAFRRNGDDLHSCVVLGKHRRLKKLLDMGMAGEALDVNGYMKDRQKRTPAMLAAKQGDMEALMLLFDAGATAHPVDLAGNTCLFHAAEFAQFAALEFLLDQDGAMEVLRKDGAKLQNVIVENVFSGYARKVLGKDELVDDYTNVIAKAKMTNRVGRGGSNRNPGMAYVKAMNIGDKVLNNFFPGAVKEEMPKAQELRSVSGLVLAHALGPLGRAFFFEKEKRKTPSLHRGDGSPMAGTVGASHISLERLTKTKVIGQGGYAHVIEVEERLGSEVGIDANGSSSFVRVLSSNVGLNWLSSFNERGGQAQSPLNKGQPEALAASSSGMNLTTTVSQTPRRFAMKLQPKTSVSAGFNVASEALALQRIQHPFIVRLEHAFQTPQFYALVLELCPRGDLNKLLVRETDERGYCSGLPTYRSARYCGQVLLALAHLHKVHGLVYRDMKPDNVLISDADEAKLADFGLVSYVGKESKAKVMSLAGTRGYAAPELITGNIWGDDEDSLDEDEINPFLTDSYSYGVTLMVVMLGEDCASKVFDEGNATPGRDSEKATVWLVPRGSSAENIEKLSGFKDRGRISEEACELITGLIQENPKKRWSITQSCVLSHQFFLKSLRVMDLQQLLHDRAGTSTIVESTMSSA